MPREPDQATEPRFAVSGRHLPALDGLRAVAILGVIAYHLNLRWVSGGYLGVDLFFVLSGFLITSLLIEEWCGSALIRMGAFWGRRARRLLPALFIVLVAVSVYAVINGRFSSPTSGGAAIDLSGLRGDALATFFYVANWHAIFAHQSYFSQFSTPSPLQHTWSLAIEEQFYLVWPFVIVALLKWGRTYWRAVGVGLCVVGALASASAMALLYHTGSDPSRVYYGTDTRAFDLLAGAALSMLVAGRTQPGRRARTRLHAVAPVAVVALAVFWARAGTAGGLPTTGMFRGGFLVCALLGAVVVADACQVQRGPLGQFLSVAPLRWVGTISYGLYLWHWPVFVYLNHARIGLSGAALDVARVGVTFAVATASFYVVERPLRRLRFSGLAPRIAAPSAALLTVLVVMIGTTPSVASPPPTWAGGGLDPGAGPGVAGAGGLGGQVRIALPRGLVISRRHPLRVLTFGDSVMSYLEKGIFAALQSTDEVTVVPTARASWGLTVPGGQAFLEDRVARFHPQLVIGTWTWDNAAAQADPTGYRATLDGALRQLLKPTGGVFGVILVQMAPLGPIPAFIAASSSGDSWRRRAAGLASWNAAVQEAPQVYPGQVMYLPAAGSLELAGRYTNWLPPSGQASAPLRTWVRVRTSDGVHLCPPGITRYAAPVLQDVTSLFGLSPPKSQWWNSSRITVRGYAHSTTSFGLTCPSDNPRVP